MCQHMPVRVWLGREAFRLAPRFTAQEGWRIAFSGGGGELRQNMQQLGNTGPGPGGHEQDRDQMPGP